MTVKKYLSKHSDRFLSELFELLRMPSVSSDSSKKKDIAATAAFVADKLRDAGCQKAELFETPFGIPIVYAERIVNPQLPTVLVYGHYDVQPPDPLELWEQPPFDPVIKPHPLHPEGAIFARGACDDKGQMYIHIKALETMAATDTLPCNVKFLIEGEEEIGSPGLSWFLEQQKALLKNDIILVSDTAMIANDCPSITVSLRGLSYMEVEVTGANRDLHSGIYGGAVANPINILCRMIASLQDENNRITIPGFHDKVIDFPEKVRAAIAEMPFSLEAYKKDLSINVVRGETGYTTNERNSIRPTLDVNGIWGGYTGEGSKTVLPGKAFAKISMRLVSNQDWNEISDLFKAHFESIAPEGVKVKVRAFHGGAPYVLDLDCPAYKAAESAYLEVFNKKPLPQYSGGSIPIVPMFEKVLGSKTILMGFGLDDDAIHSPNEHFGVGNFFKGIEASAAFFKHFSESLRDRLQ